MKALIALFLALSPPAFAEEFITFGALDGDTIIIGMPCNDLDRDNTSVRIFGIDTAEKKLAKSKRSRAFLPGSAKCEAEAKHGLEAQKYAQTLIKRGDRVKVEFKGNDKYYCRILGKVTLPDGRDWATVMLNTNGSNGKPFAVPYFGKTKTSWCK